MPKGAYLEAIDEVGQSVQLYDAWMRVIAGAPDVPKVVVTAGIPQLWRCVLDRYGIHDVPVLGGLHSAMDESFVTPQCKAWIVRELRGSGFRVVAAGDSEIDLEMLSAADLGVISAEATLQRAGVSPDPDSVSQRPAGNRAGALPAKHLRLWRDHSGRDCYLLSVPHAQRPQGPRRR